MRMKRPRKKTRRAAADLRGGHRAAAHPLPRGDHARGVGMGVGQEARLVTGDAERELDPHGEPLPGAAGPAEVPRVGAHQVEPQQELVGGAAPRLEEEAQVRLVGQRAHAGAVGGGVQGGEAAPGGEPLRGGGARQPLARLHGEHPVVLLGVHPVVPEPVAVQRDLELGGVPGLLEPLVDPLEEDPSRHPGGGHLAREPCVHLRHERLGVPAVVPPLRVQVGHPDAGGDAVLGDQDREVGVVLLECVRIPSSWRVPRESGPGCTPGPAP